MRTAYKSTQSVILTRSVACEGTAERDRFKRTGLDAGFGREASCEFRDGAQGVVKNKFIEW